VGGDGGLAVAKRERRTVAWVSVSGSRAREKRLASAGGRGGCGVGDGPPVEVVLRAAAASASVDGPSVEVVPPRPMWLRRWRAGGWQLVGACTSTLSLCGESK
jgi:hypothetical protein